jgi:molybdate transport system substrate-binding protein
MNTTTTRLVLSLVGILSFVLALACRKHSGNAPTNSSDLLVAAAANLQDAFTDLGKRFTEQTGIGVIFNFAGTAELEKQIENGAPFDVFAAADVTHVEILERAGLITTGTKSL